MKVKKSSHTSPRSPNNTTKQTPNKKAFPLGLVNNTCFIIIGSTTLAASLAALNLKNSQETQLNQQGVYKVGSFTQTESATVIDSLRDILKNPYQENSGVSYFEPTHIDRRRFCSVTLGIRNNKIIDIDAKHATEVFQKRTCETTNEQGHCMNPSNTEIITTIPETIYLFGPETPHRSPLYHACQAHPRKDHPQYRNYLSCKYERIDFFGDRDGNQMIGKIYEGSTNTNPIDVTELHQLMEKKCLMESDMMTIRAHPIDMKNKIPTHRVFIGIFGKKI